MRCANYVVFPQRLCAAGAKCLTTGGLMPGSDQKWQVMISVLEFTTVEDVALERQSNRGTPF